MMANKEHYATTLGELTKKSGALFNNLCGKEVKTHECQCKLKNFLKFTKELNLAVNQECIKALAFN